MAASNPIRIDSAVATIEASSEPRTAAVAAWLTPPTPYSRIASGSNSVRKLMIVGCDGTHIAGAAFQSVGGLRAVITIQNTGNSVMATAPNRTTTSGQDSVLLGISDVLPGVGRGPGSGADESATRCRPAPKTPPPLRRPVESR